jgi:hypothetical protein
MTTPVSSGHSFAPAIDWLTIASYQFTPYTEMAASLRRFLPHGWKRSRWLQYDGWHNPDGIFHGHALQSNDKEHYIVKISGALAHEWLHDMLGDPDGWQMLQHWYATRLDIQVTKPVPDWWLIRNLHDNYMAQGRNVSIIQSATGSTLYLGARTSDRFVRFYEKQLETMYLRLEFELKGRFSRHGFIGLLDGTITVADLFAGHLAALRLPEEQGDYYFPDDAKDISFPKHIRMIDNDARLKWLLSLQGKFAQMANDHDIGERVRDIFASLAIDNYPENADN